MRAAFLCLPHLKRGCALPYNRLRKEKNNGILPPIRITYEGILAYMEE